jgi:hypothetical protein
VCLELQVLKALTKASGADAAKHLRHAAAHLYAAKDTSPWLNASDLVPRVLAILRSLPSGQPPRAAIATCAAAAAVLHNLLLGLHTPHQLSQLRGQLEADQAACAALVHWGVARPEASEQLPPAQRSKMRLGGHLAPEEAVGVTEHPFWTPFTMCCLFLAVVDVTEVKTDAYALPCYSENLASWNVPEAATPDVIGRLLRVAIQHPCAGTRLPDVCILFRTFKHFVHIQ